MLLLPLLSCDGGPDTVPDGDNPSALSTDKPPDSRPPTETDAGPANHTRIKPRETDDPAAKTPTKPDETPIPPEPKLPPRPADASVKDAIAALERKLVALPASDSIKRELAVLYWLDDRPDKAIECFESISSKAPDGGFELIKAAVLNDLGENPEAMVALDDVRAGWKAIYPLKAGKPVFCYYVGGFDTYTPVEKPLFIPGQGVPVYLPVDNLAPEKISDGKFKTSIAVSVSLATTGEKPITIELDQAKTTWDVVRETTGYPDDFYIAFTFYIPKGLMSGSYTLAISLSTPGPKGALKKTVATSEFWVR